MGGSKKKNDKPNDVERVVLECPQPKRRSPRRLRLQFWQASPVVHWGGGKGEAAALDTAGPTDGRPPQPVMSLAAAARRAPHSSRAMWARPGAADGGGPRRDAAGASAARSASSSARAAARIGKGAAELRRAAHSNCPGPVRREPAAARATDLGRGFGGPAEFRGNPTSIPRRESRRRRSVESLSATVTFRAIAVVANAVFYANADGPDPCGFRRRTSSPG